MSLRLDWELGQQRLAELRRHALAHHVVGRAAGHRAMTLLTGPFWRSLRERLGNRIINLGCRLAGPAVVADARRGI